MPTHDFGRNKSASTEIKKKQIPKVDYVQVEFLKKRGEKAI